MSTVKTVDTSNTETSSTIEAVRDTVFRTYMVEQTLDELKDNMELAPFSDIIRQLRDISRRIIDRVNPLSSEDTIKKAQAIVSGLTVLTANMCSALENPPEICKVFIESTSIVE